MTNEQLRFLILAMASHLESIICEINEKLPDETAGKMLKVHLNDTHPKNDLAGCLMCKNEAHFEERPVGLADHLRPLLGLAHRWRSEAEITEVKTGVHRVQNPHLEDEEMREMIIKTIKDDLMKNGELRRILEGIF